MKTICVPRPDWVPESGWELTDYTFDIEDGLPPVLREKISRRANALAIVAARLLADDLSIYEDLKAQDILVELWAMCRPAVLGVTLAGRELTPAERQEVLDNLNFLSRDALANEIIGANQLGLKKK